MSWSVYYDGEFNSVVKDSYHRICLQFNIWEVSIESTNKLVDLIKSGCRHFMVIINSSDMIPHQHWSLFDSMIKNIKEIINIRDLCFSIQLSGIHITSIVTKINKILSPNIVLIDSSGQEASYIIDNINKLQKAISPPLPALGISNTTDTYFIEKILKHSIVPISFLSVGVIDVPNFRLRSLEFVHSKHICSLIVLKPEDLITDNCDYEMWTTLSEKYNKHISSIITKACIQLGAVVCLPLLGFFGDYPNANANDSLLHEHIAPLCHPFTYRKDYLAPTVPIRFHIDDDDMQRLRDDSELLEAEAEDDVDVDWTKITSESPEMLHFTFQTKFIQPNMKSNKN